MKLIVIIWVIGSLATLGWANDLDATTSCINEFITTFKDRMSPRLYEVFAKSFPNTMSTTVAHFELKEGKESTYIITGDIEAMWLRDSTSQFLPYFAMQKDCPHIKTLAQGLINTQTQFILIDPYTNAFKKYQQTQATRHFYLNDKTNTLVMGIPVDLCRQKEFATKAIWERKFEIDSLASFLRLSFEFSKKYKDISFVNIHFLKAIKRILTVLDQQLKDSFYQDRLIKKQFYTFQRISTELPAGKIRPSHRTGLIKTGFRPSDDPNELAYNIPGNAMMSTFLKLVAENVLNKIEDGHVLKQFASTLSLKMLQISNNLRKAIFEFGVVDWKGHEVFAYEIDGLGGAKVYDDANLPSLISLPYLHFIEETNPTYLNTRKMLLSRQNVFFFERDEVKGIGSSHTSNRYIWPLALIAQIMTTNNDEEIKNCLNSLLKSAKNNLMHQSFSIDQPASITREWFAWANSFFGEMILDLATRKPHLLQ